MLYLKIKLKRTSQLTVCLFWYIKHGVFYLNIFGCFLEVLHISISSSFWYFVYLISTSLYYIDKKNILIPNYHFSLFYIKSSKIHLYPSLEHFCEFFRYYAWSTHLWKKFDALLILNILRIWWEYLSVYLIQFLWKYFFTE